MTNKSLGLYVHIPFCKRKCSYCDFCSGAGYTQAERHAYIERLVEEIKGYKSKPKKKLTSIFFGGGTPSLLTGKEFEKITRSIKENFEISEDFEFTVEANPGTLDREGLLEYKRLGVNRLSIGLQSIHENELKILGRIHNYEDFVTVFRMAREVGFDNINVDLMYSIPEQNSESLKKTLDAVLSLSPEHISAYSLILEEGTPLYENRGSYSFPDDDVDAQNYDLICRTLSQNGYLHYEISNYARNGRESRHNLIYWRAKEYIGVGVSAHSYYGGVRYSNSSSFNDYLNGVSGDKRPLSARERAYEYVMLGLRLGTGISLSKYKEKFGEDFLLGREEIIGRLRENGLLDMREDRIFLTEKGLYVSNAVLVELL